MERMGIHRAAEPSVRQELVVLKGFCVSVLPELSGGPTSQASSLPTQGLSQSPAHSFLPCDRRSDCLVFTGKRPQRWAPSAALNKERLPGSCCLLLQVNVSSCYRVWLRMAPSQELLFYPASSVIGWNPVTHTPNPVFLVGDAEKGCVCVSKWTFSSMT